jgi:hypothetical protein
MECGAFNYSCYPNAKPVVRKGRTPETKYPTTAGDDLAVKA